MEKQAPSLTETSRPRELILALGPSVNLTLVPVPAGEFCMGSTVEQDEEPEHTVRLDEFWIGKYPVTVAQFAAFVRATEYACECRDDPLKQQHPATYVSWNDANAFCEWASGLTRHPLRLPTEAEWEKAARGSDGRPYPWGRRQPDPTLCNFKDNVGDSTPVHKYSPQGHSPCGCADMAGNAYEWVADWYAREYYAHAPCDNPKGPTSGVYRVLRGGCSHDERYDVRASYRYFDCPEYRFSFVGFRCAQ